MLIAGAECLVRGASSISRRLGISPLVIGLTVVAFGTSAPELVVNVLAATQGTTDIALGNIIGSNIANILLILGVSALLTNLKVQHSTTWKEIPFAFLAMVMVFVMARDIWLDGSGVNSITRTDGFGLLGFFGIFLYYTYALTKQTSEKEEDTIQQYSTTIAVVLTLFGLLGLFVGGRLLVDQAVFIARLFGISEALIGLTVVSIGTSLPELATSIIAAMKKQNDIAVGNVVGSNIFNVFFILGTSSVLAPLPVTAIVQQDILFAVFVTSLLFITMFVGKRHQLQRWQGGIFVTLYLAYTLFLIQRG